MRQLTLKRPEISEDGAFGVLLWEGKVFAVTLERTYPGQSTQTVKVKPGEYRLVRATYHHGRPKPYQVWQVIGGDITAERRILIHKANVEEELDGCIAVGESFDLVNGKRGILQSGHAFEELMRLTKDVDEVGLAVENV